MRTILLAPLQPAADRRVDSALWMGRRQEGWARVMHHARRPVHPAHPDAACAKEEKADEDSGGSKENERAERERDDRVGAPEGGGLKKGVAAPLTVHQPAVFARMQARCGAAARYRLHASQRVCMNKYARARLFSCRNFRSRSCDDKTLRVE